MAPVVNLGAFHHEEETFLVIQHLNGLQGAFHQDGAAVQGGFEVIFVVQAQELVPGGVGNVFQLFHIGVALGLHFLNEVAAVGALVPEMGAAPADEIHARVHILGCEAFLVLAGRTVDAEIGRSGVIDATGDGNARLHSLHAFGPLEVGFHLVSVGSQADISILGLGPVGQGRAARAGIGDKAVGGIGAGITGHRHLVDVQGPAVGHPAHAPLAQAGAVANHKDDVFDLFALGLCHVNGLVGRFHLVLIVLGEGIGGVLGTVPVQFFRRLGKSLQGAQRQDHAKDSLHHSAILAFQPEKPISAPVQPWGRVQ